MLDDVLNLVAAKVFTDGRVEGAEFGERVFVLRAVALVAVRFPVFRRMISSLDLVERKHRHEMFDAGKLFAGRAADALRGRFRPDEAGENFLKFLKLLEQLVVFAVGDELPAFDVVGVVVPADLTGKLRVAFLGGSVCHGEKFNSTRIKRKEW